jgi:hypothetical protein
MRSGLPSAWGSNVSLGRAWAGKHADGEESEENGFEKHFERQ